MTAVMFQWVAGFLVEVLFEMLFLGLAYWTDVGVLSVASFGRLQCAPFSEFGLPRRSGPSRIQGARRRIRAEWVCVTGVIFLLLLLVAAIGGGSWLNGSR